MRKRTASLFCLALCAAGFALWHAQSGPGVRTPLRVFFTGETGGELEPCNCGGTMAGGLPARGGYLDAQQGPRLLLDTGCIGAGARDFEVLRTEAALRAMAVMKYDAANIGEREVWLGRAELARLGTLGVPFVSANLVGDDGKCVASPCIFKEIAGTRVAVTGVVSGGIASAGPGLHIQPPAEVLARLIPELSKQCGVLVLLADMEREKIKEVAGQYPEITLILFRGRGQSTGPERVNRSFIASVYGEARYIGELTLSWPDGPRASAEGSAVLLDARCAPSTAVTQAGLEWYKQTVSGKTFDLSQNRPGWERIRHQTPESGNGYAGPESCKGCHPKAYEKWSRTAHAAAMNSLEKAGYASSPECVVCHSTGYGAQDGYRSAQQTPALGKVGCEVCHGRGQILARGNCKNFVRKPSEQACRECHTAKQHAAFSYCTSWPKIEHSER